MTTEAAQAGYRELLEAMPETGTPCTRNPKPYQTPEGADYAKALCRNRCPIKDQCFVFGDTNKFEGIWGGTDDNERLSMRRAEAGRRGQALRRARLAETQHTLDDTMFGIPA
jgi:hypothetical protein